MEDVLTLEKLCDKFMRSFEDVLGISEMKYSIHLVSHIPIAVKLYGPLHILSCYGPEDQIGRTTRKILSMNNTTKHIMNNAIIHSDCTLILEGIRLNPDKTDYRVMGEIRSALGLRSGAFVKTDQDGSCRMLGKATQLVNHCLYERVQAKFSEEPFSMEQLFVFYRAQIENGIFVQSDIKSNSTCRNEHVVMDKFENVVKIEFLLALVNTSYDQIIGLTHVGMSWKKKTLLTMLEFTVPAFPSFFQPKQQTNFT